MTDRTRTFVVVDPPSPRPDPAPGWVNHWDDYRTLGRMVSCDREREHCHRCGLQMIETIEPTGTMSRRTGSPMFARWHSCPTWVDEGWRTKRWAKGWACPGWGHDSHDADNPLLTRSYR